MQINPPSKELGIITNIDKRHGLAIIENKRRSDEQNKPHLFIDRGSPLHQEVSNLKNGEDAIAFFARHGSTTPIKFLHCNQTS